jgi:hypothetical protein
LASDDSSGGWCMVPGTMSRFVLGSVFALALLPSLTSLGCGGTAQPAAAPVSKAPPAAPAPAPVASEKPAPKVETVEDQRESFIGSCVQKTNQREFCDCSFEQFKVIFKDADFSKPLANSDPRVAELQSQTSKACAGKLPESEVRSSFMEACGEGDKSKSSYCECAWTSLRKTLSVADFGNESALADERGLAARKTMVTDCKGKYPAEVAKKEFLDVCIQNTGGTESVCNCRWTKLKKQMTVEEIVAGTGDVASVKGIKDCK